MIIINNLISNAKYCILTSYKQRDRVTSAFPFAVSCHAGVVPGRSSRDTLQHQALGAEDDAQCFVMEDLNILKPKTIHNISLKIANLRLILKVVEPTVPL